MPGTGSSIEPEPTGPEATRARMLAHAEAQAQAALRDKLDFIDQLGAELTAGLHGVLALAELLEAQPLGGEAPAYAASLADCGRTLLGVVADAVALSQAEGGQLVLSPVPARPRDLLDEVEAEWRPRAAQDGVALGVAFHGDAGLAAELDSAKLRQVYGALIGHSLKRTRRGGVEARLEAARDGDRTMLKGQVRDTGRPIDPDRLPALFEPFGRERRAAYGSGLELALARRLIEAMGGRISAESNQGSGLTVQFQFDALTCAAPGDAGEGAEPEAAPLSGRVLIVDDNATNRMVARTLVELFGCACQTAEDGIEAVEAVTRERFDAVLMDIRMPRMDGLAATRAIRALPGGRNLPIIALTANADPKEVLTYRAAGMSDVVDKPIKAERLLTALQEALEPVSGSNTAWAAA